MSLGSRRTSLLHVLWPALCSEEASLKIGVSVRCAGRVIIYEHFPVGVVNALRLDHFPSIACTVVQYQSFTYAGNDREYVFCKLCTYFRFGTTLPSPLFVIGAGESLGQTSKVLFVLFSL